MKYQDTICNIVDKLSKKRHYIAISKELDLEQLAVLFLKHVWKQHSLFRNIMSDQRGHLISNFWTSYAKS